MNEVEPNDLISNSQSLGAIEGPTQLNGSLTSIMDVDWYVFTVPSLHEGATPTVTIHFFGPAALLKAAIYNDPLHKGPYINGAHTSPETITMTGLTTGTYYLRVWNYSNLAYIATFQGLGGGDEP